MDQCSHGFFVLDIQRQVLDHVKVVNNFHNALIQLVEFRGEELVHIRQTISGAQLNHTLQVTLVLDLVAFCKHVEVRDAQLSHGGKRSIIKNE